jgi:hypothetical protein
VGNVGQQVQQQGGLLDALLDQGLDAGQLAAADRGQGLGEAEVVRQPGQRLLPGRRGEPVPAVGAGPGREVVVIGGQEAAFAGGQQLGWCVE